MDAKIVKEIKRLQGMSRCPRRSVGVLLYDRNMLLLSGGYNAPDVFDCYSNPCSKLRGRSGCLAKHAEIMALEGCYFSPYFMYGTRSPCMECSEALAKCGVKVIFVLTYDWNRKRDLFLQKLGISMKVV